MANRKSKIDELLQLLMKVDNLAMEQVIENTLLIGLEHRHPYLGMYLNGSFSSITYDDATRTWSLQDSHNKLQQITELEIEQWQKPLNFRRKKKVVG
jgi:hypothetical protein